MLLWIVFVISVIVWWCCHGASGRGHSLETSCRFFVLSVVGFATALVTAIMGKVANNNFIPLIILGIIINWWARIEEEQTSPHTNPDKRERDFRMHLISLCSACLTIGISFAAICMSDSTQFICILYIFCLWYFLDGFFRKKLYMRGFVVCLLIIMTSRNCGIESDLKSKDRPYTEVKITAEWKLVPITKNGKAFGKELDDFLYVKVSNDDKSYLVYYLIGNDENETDQIKVGKLEADVTTLFIVDDCVPHIVEYTTVYHGVGGDGVKNITYEIYTTTGTAFKVPDLNSQ